MQRTGGCSRSDERDFEELTKEGEFSKFPPRFETSTELEGLGQ